MSWILSNIALNEFASRAALALADSSLKGLLLLSLAALAAWALQRQSAAARHLVWALALAGLLALPGLSALMPKWQLPILPRAASLLVVAPPPAPVVPLTPVATLPSPGRKGFTEKIALPSNGNPRRVEPRLAQAASSHPPKSLVSPAIWVLSAWFSGALAMLAPLAMGLALVARLRHRAHPLEREPWGALLARLADTLRLKRRVSLLLGPTSTMPMALGLLHPAILLPFEAETWDEERRRVVLLHELAHVRRRDGLTQALARLALALHWFNPLAWLALARLRAECERACDDLVLSAGSRPSDYADHLLEIARTMEANPLAAAAAITMARRSRIEARLLAILDAGRNRRAVTRWALGAGILILLAAIIPLSVTQLSRKNPAGKTFQTPKLLGLGWTSWADEAWNNKNWVVLEDPRFGRLWTPEGKDIQIKDLAINPLYLFTNASSNIYERYPPASRFLSLAFAFDSATMSPPWMDLKVEGTTGTLQRMGAEGGGEDKMIKRRRWKIFKLVADSTATLPGELGLALRYADGEATEVATVPGGLSSPTDLGDGLSVRVTTGPQGKAPPSTAIEITDTKGFDERYCSVEIIPTREGRRQLNPPGNGYLFDYTDAQPQNHRMIWGRTYSLEPDQIAKIRILTHPIKTTWFKAALLPYPGTANKAGIQANQNPRPAQAAPAATPTPPTAPVLTLKITDAAGKPVAGAEAHFHKIGHNGFGVRWEAATSGTIEFTQEKITRDLYGEKWAGKYLISVRAPGYAPRLLTVDLPAPGGAVVPVTMAKGKTFELTLRDGAGRPIPETLDPAAFYPEQATHAWDFMKTQTEQPWGSSRMSVSTMEKLGSGRYRFQWDESAPKFYILISEPGFLRGFQAGPFSREQWASGKIEIELPVPGTLVATVHAPAGFTGVNPTKACAFNIIQTRTMPPKANGGEDYATSAGFSYWFKMQDGTQTSVTLSDMPPGRYNVDGQSRQSSLNIDWSGNQSVEIKSGETAKADFAYKLEDESKTKGDYAASVAILRRDGSPAAGVPYRLTYYEPGFLTKTISEGLTSEKGMIALAGLAGGAAAPGYDLSVAEINVGAIQCLGTQKRQEFKFVLPPLTGDPAPDLTLFDVQTEKTVKLSEFKGQVVLLDFWATWCGPCQKPMLHLNEIAAKHKADWNGKVVLLAASIDDDLAVLRGHIAKNNFGQVCQAWCKSDQTGWKAEAAKVYGINSVPTTLLIDTTGKIIYRGNPNDFDAEELINTRALKLAGAISSTSSTLASVAPATATTATLDSGPDALKKALAALEQEKNIGALRQLLKLNGQDPTMADQIGVDDQSLASVMNIGKDGVRRITSAGGDFIVVHARNVMAIPQKFRAQLPNGLGLAIFFDEYGQFAGKVGGEPGSDPNDPNSFTTDVLTSPLGTADRWFTWVTRLNKQGGFNYDIDVYLIQHKRPQVPLALRIHAVSCSMSFSNTLKDSIDGTSHFLSPSCDKPLGPHVDPMQSGLGQDNKPTHPILRWDAENGLFRGPSRFSYDGKTIFEVDLKESAYFLPNDRPLPAFSELYSLKPGEALRRIAPPLIPARREYFTDYNKQHSVKNPPPMTAQFIWDNDLSLGCQTFGDDEGNTVDAILNGYLDLKHYEFEGPEALLATKVRGDWIVRRDATPAQRMKDLEGILNSQLSLGLRIERRRVEREVIAASGRFTFKPLSVEIDPTDKDRTVHIYTDVLRKGGWNSNQGGDTVGQLLKRIGDFLSIPVIDETDPAAADLHRTMRWLSYDAPPASDTAAVARLLQNVTKQTALQFRRERRPVEVWFITRP